MWMEAKLKKLVVPESSVQDDCRPDLAGDPPDPPSHPAERLLPAECGPHDVSVQGGGARQGLPGQPAEGRHQGAGHGDPQPPQQAEGGCGYGHHRQSQENAEDLLGNV